MNCMVLSSVREAKIKAFLYTYDPLVKVADVCAQEQKPIKPAWKIVVSNHQALHCTTKITTLNNAFFNLLLTFIVVVCSHLLQRFHDLLWH